MNGKNDCVAPLDFPKLIHNRPGLARIDYRIGTYSHFREAMLRSLDRNAKLSGWTHREPDDPGIALLEGAAVVGDILTLYQEAYANEVYLRTALWRESISELVRLLGYRMSPAIGGGSTFAFEVRGDDTVRIPVGFPVKAELEAHGPADFETVAAITAHPELGVFQLHRKARLAAIQDGLATFSAVTSELEDRMGTLEPGNRLYLVKDPSRTDSQRQIVVVKEVEELFDWTHITVEGSWQKDAVSAPLTAFKLGRSFRHFGYNAPAASVSMLHGAVTADSGSDEEAFDGVKSYPLSAEVDDLAVGSTMLVELEPDWSDGIEGERAFFETQITATSNRTWSSGVMTGATTVVTLDSSSALASETYSNPLGMHYFEVLGESLGVRGAREADPAGNLGTLHFYGSSDSYELLDGRRLMFVHEDGTSEILTVSTESADVANPGLKRLYVPEFTEPFEIDDFPLFDESPVTVYGNLADATQGATKKEVSLGNGDSRQQFQTFKVPKSPLTYLNSVGETPPEAPELDVYVEDRLWQRVPSFFGHGPEERIYVVREDLKGDSWVQFGDGKTGRRLPSGLENVTAIQRSGAGAYGALKQGAHPHAGERIDGLGAIHMPAGATGGAAAESGDDAREAAPGRVQSLGRLVGLSDFESEALAIPGVSKARAVWGLVENVPAVQVVVLMDTGRADEFTQVKHILNEYSRCRGPDRFPVEVVQGLRHYVYVSIDVGYGATYRSELVGAAIQDALGARSGGAENARGLFATQTRRFGEPEYASRVTGCVQNVTGVVWAQLRGFDTFGPAAEPDALAVPSAMVLKGQLDGNASGIYSLRDAHLRLRFVAATPEDSC